MESESYKEQGNVAFKENKWDEALKYYTLAINNIKGEPKELGIYYKNRAAVYLKLEKYQEAVDDCNKSLHIAPDDPKALFRRCQALDSLERFEEAYRDATHIFKDDPSNKAVQPYLQRLHQIVEERSRVNAQTNTKLESMLKIVFDPSNGKDKRETAINNLLVLSKEHAGSEIMLKQSPIVQKIKSLLKIEKNHEIYITAVRIIGELCKHSEDSTKIVIKDAGVPWFLEILDSSNQDIVNAVQFCIQAILNSLSGMKNKPDSKPNQQLVDKNKSLIDTLLSCLAMSINNQVISGLARDAVIELLTRNIHYTTLDWAERLVELDGVKKLMDCASELEEYHYESAMNITPSTRTIAAVCLARVYENMYYDEAREKFLAKMQDFIKNKLLTPDIESKVRITVAITALLRGPLDVGNTIIGKEGILEMIIVMANTEDELQQKVACECLIAAASKADKARSIVSQGTDILKKLYKAKNDHIRIRALVGLCKLGSYGGSDASVKPFAEGSTLKLAEACRRFLLHPGKDTDIRKWAAEGLSYLTLDAEVKEKLIEDKAAIKSLVELAKSGDQSVIFGVVTTFVNLCNAYEKQEIIPEMIELAKFAKQHIPEEHELDDPDFVTKRLLALGNENVTTALVALSKTESANSRELISRVFNALASEHEIRGIMVQQGAVKVLIKLALDGTEKGKHQAAQALARIGITINPEVAFAGQRSLEVARPLLSLLHQDCSGLENFEALMALCNIAQINESSRQRIIKEGGFLKIEHYLYEDHVMLSRAAIQCMCNLAQSEDVVKTYYEGDNDRIIYIVACCLDEDKDTAMAAGGLLAILTSYSKKCCQKVFDSKNWLEALQCLLANSIVSLQYRGVCIISNIVAAGRELAEKVMETNILEILFALKCTVDEDNLKKIKEVVDEILQTSAAMDIIEDMRLDVIKKIRSFCTIHKGPLLVNQLVHDYKDMIGTKIPFRDLGFKTLDDFLKSEETFHLSKKGSDLYLTAEVSEKTAHIADMVAKQKAKKKPPKVHFAPVQPRYNQTAKWRPKSNLYGSQNQYHASMRPKAVSHTQFVNRAVKTPKQLKVTENATAQMQQIKKFDPSYRQNSRTEVKFNTNNSHHNKNGPHNHFNNGPSNYSNTQSSRQIPYNHHYQESNINNVANPLLATKRRITKKMSELSLERDSGNSSPTSDNLSPTYKPEFVRTDDPLADLKYFAELHNLGDVEVNIAQVNTKQNKFYSCKIKIGAKYTYSSYPSEFLNSTEAQTYCCNEALKDLIPKTKRKFLMISSEADILERIPPMLEKHNFGIWAWQLKLDYSDKYNEMLPDDWIKIIDSSPCVQIEKRSNDYIMYHCIPGNKGQQRTVEFSVVEVSVPSNTVQFSEDGKLTGEITCAISVNEIWCRQIGTEESKLYVDMMQRLQMYYQECEKQLIPRTICRAGYYVARYDDEFCRVRAVNVKDQDVDCFFIDWGDELSIPKSNIFEIRREYAYAQAQAFVCRLSGLEELYGISGASQSITSLEKMQVELEMAVENPTTSNTNEALPVFMYSLETGKSINEELIPKLTMELASPTLQKDTITEAYVSNIEPNGDVYVQIRTQGYENFCNLKEQIENQFKCNSMDNILYNVTKNNSVGMLYFIKRSNGIWYRAKLIDWSPKEKLYPLDKINEVFSNYPHQALKLRMALDKIPDDFIDLASKPLQPDNPVLLKVVGVGEDNVRLVELFKRNTDGGLFCINKSIALESEIKQKNGDHSAKGKTKFSTNLSFAGNVPSAGYLKSPPLPDRGNYFEVCIPFAVNPYNFFVQPLKSKPQLDGMMEELQMCYKDVQYGKLNIDDILPGNIYASKHDDGFWYRTSVIKVIHSGSVSVFFCDFGYYQTLHVKQLVPLDDEFKQLPYQALKAKLTGVKPIQSKWTMEGCDEFKKMIEKKNFVALYVDQEKDILYESDIILKIILIDTSSDADIYIDLELIKYGIATKDTFISK
ncbi:hypothetical protein GWI33_005992 [Rhynchophorus ferrugineus]|uniref:Protein unc-45 homolog B n=1 Tax=Rhynchophorus ferrugineus TaxID=354439 RepID=A0A834IW95_RHYFE|nr:hypothetical protein GWI33_005992 [Rhynchophorus ferrugineus]